MATKKPPTLSQKLKDPKWRVSLPASRLTSAQRKERRRLKQVKADDANPLYDPSSQLQGHDLAVAAARSVDAGLTPKLGAIDQQIGSTRTQDTALAQRAAAYYRQLATESAGLTGRQQAAAGAANQAVTANNAQADQALADSSTAEQRRQADDAALRGGGLGGDTATVARTISEAQQQRAILGPAQAATVAAQGEGWTGLSNAMAQASQMRGGEVQGELANAAGNTAGRLSQQRADLAGTRGDLVSEAVDKLRQQGFENAITQQGLGIKQADIAATLRGQDVSASTAAANRRQTAADRAAGRGVTTRGQDLSHQDRTSAQRTAAQKKEQQRVQQVRTAATKAWGSVENLLPKLSGGRVRLDPKGQPVASNDTTTPVVSVRPPTTQETINNLRAQNLPEWAIQAAVSIKHHGYVTPEVITLIRSTAPAVRIPNRYRPPSMRKASGAGAYPVKGSPAAGA
jgi:hypothetical protein